MEDSPGCPHRRVLAGTRTGRGVSRNPTAMTAWLATARLLLGTAGVLLAAAAAAGLLLVAAERLEAASFCVTTSDELRAALSDSRTNGEPDTIRVVQGVYATGLQGEYYYYTAEDHALVLLGGHASGRGTRVLDPTNTILDGQDANRVMNLSPANDSGGPLYVQGFTFQNGLTTGFSSGGGLTIGGSAGHSGDVTVDHCIFRDNHTDLFGGGLAGGSDTGETHIENCLLFANSAGEAHGAAALTCNGTAYITNNTVHGNTAPARGGFRLGGSPAATQVMSNNIFHGNADADLILDSSGIVLKNNDIGVQVGMEAAGSSGNVSVDPQFIGGGDYHLLSFSALVDGGINDPPGGLGATDIEGADRIYNGTVDIGAYEWAGQPDAVELTAFAATVLGNAIRLSWETAFESDHLGFHVLRARGTDGETVPGADGGPARGADGERTRLTAALIAAPGPYAYVDQAIEPGMTYAYWLEAVGRSGESEFFGPVTATAPAARRHVLLQSRPNPLPAASSSIEIGFELASPALAGLRMYDASGRLVRELLEAPLAPGSHAVTWDGRDGRGVTLGAGVYFYRLEAGAFTATRRLVRIR